MRVLVCGGRDFNNFLSVAFHLSHIEPTVIIHGGAKGADEMANLWADINGVDVERYPADWKTHGKSAGPIRNQQMIDEGKPDLVIAFPGGKGTNNMVSLAMKSGIKIRDLRQA